MAKKGQASQSDLGWTKGDGFVDDDSVHSCRHLDIEGEEEEEEEEEEEPMWSHKKEHGGGRGRRQSRSRGRNSPTSGTKMEEAKINDH